MTQNAYPTSSHLTTLPRVLWFLDEGDMVVCRGEPEEILRGLARQKGVRTRDRSIRPLLDALGALLAKERGILIELEDDVPDQKAAALFVHALIVTRLARVMGSS